MHVQVNDVWTVTYIIYMWLILVLRVDLVRPLLAALDYLVCESVCLCVCVCVRACVRACVHVCVTVI